MRSTDSSRNSIDQSEQVQFEEPLCAIPSIQSNRSNNYLLKAITFFFDVGLFEINKYFSKWSSQNRMIIGLCIL